MKGLELSEHFYWDVVSPLIDRKLPCLKGKYAAGLIGYGSDILGFDDEISRDHEWGPRAYLWLSQADYVQYASSLNQVFQEELPVAYEGFYTRYIVDPQIHCLVPSAHGDIHHIAITTVRRHMWFQLGLRRSILDTIDWLCLPEQKLLEFTRGKIFNDPVGKISQLRQALIYFPDEVWRFKLVYAWECIDNISDVIFLNASRGDMLSARINLNSLITSIIRLVFLLNKRYCPGTPKWISREFYTLPLLAKDIGKQLEKCQTMDDINQCQPILDNIMLSLVEEHNQQKITDKVKLEGGGFRPKMNRYSMQPVVQSLLDSLPKMLREFEIHGGIDQWITNPDILIWAEQFSKLKRIFRLKNSVKRNGIGDRIV